MPFYTARRTVGRHCRVYDADTDEVIDKVESVDTDKGVLVEFIREVENGKRRMRREVRTGNFYVKDMRTDEVNPPSDEAPPVVAKSRVEAMGDNMQRMLTPYRAGREAALWESMPKEKRDAIIKSEAGTPPDRLLNHIELDVLPYLSDHASELYGVRLTSVVTKYYQGPNGELIYPTPLATRLPVSEGPARDLITPKERYENKGYTPKNTFVRFIGKQVTLYDGTIPERLIERWAKVLNLVADKGIWEFGILLPARAMALDVWGDGTPWDTESARRVCPEYDPRDPRAAKSPPVETVIITDEDIAKRGRRVLLMAYVGIHPLVDDNIDDSDDQKFLNDLVGNELFISGGQAGNSDWAGLPE